MSKTNNYQVAGTFDVSTTGNIDDLDFQSCAVIRMTNASLATIRGLKAGYPGQEVSIVSAGAGQVDLPHQNGGSVAANQLFNPLTGVPMPLAAGKGVGTYKYDETTARWRQSAFNQGAPVAIPYADLAFTADAGTWTVDSGDVGAFNWTYTSGNSVIINYDIQHTTTSALIGSDLIVTLPASVPAASGSGVVLSLNSSVATAGRAVGFQFMVGGTRVLTFKRIPVANWPVETNNLDVQGTFIYPGT